MSEHLDRELLAAYALRSLDEDEMREAEVLLSSHLPECDECRTVLEGFFSVVGEMALAVPPRRPPRLLWARIRRDLRPKRTRLAVASVWATAAAVVIVGLAVYGLYLSGRVSKAEDRQAKTTEVLAAVSDPQHHLITLAPTAERADNAIQLAATYIPGRAGLYLFGSMPEPRPNRVYQVWLRQNGQFSSAGTFVPERRHVLVRIEVDPSPYDGLLITEEPEHGSMTPSTRQVVTASL